MATKKEIPVHLDILGRPVEVGDFVAVSRSNKLEVSQIIKLMPKMIKVKIVGKSKSWSWKGEENVYSSEAVKIEGPDLTVYLLKQGA